MAFTGKHTEEAKEKIRIYMKNRVVTDETREKLSIALKGKKTYRVPKTTFKKGSIPFNKGTHIKTNTGKTHLKKGHIPWNKGKTGMYSPEVIETFRRNSIKRFSIKEQHPRYKKDRSTLVTKQIRNDSAYQNWRKEVWLRDNFKCKIANPDCNGRIEAHHILAWRDSVELRYEINNGITLCHAHHPRKRAEEKRLSPYFMELVSVSKTQIDI